jgi:hypothetical protein
MVMTGIVELPQAANYVELDWYDENEVVEVRPRDKQRFEVQKDRAIEILRVAKEGDRFQTQFQFLLNTLAAWDLDLVKVKTLLLPNVSRCT